MFGNIYKRFDIKLSFLGAVFIFEVGSLICAVAKNSTTFIVGRAIAGVSRFSRPWPSLSRRGLIGVDWDRRNVLWRNRYSRQY